MSTITIQAENYKSAKDSTPGNRGGAYRNGDVDIRSMDNGRGFFVNQIEKGEWLKYDVNIPKSGTYEIVAHAARHKVGPHDHFLGISVGQKQTKAKIVNTGDWQNFNGFRAGRLELKAGRTELRLDILNHGYNIDRIELRPVGNFSIATQRNSYNPPPISSKNNSLQTSSKSNSPASSGTNEKIIGSQTNDILIGDNNTKILSGRRGRDIIDGGKNSEVLSGGAGKDTFVLEKREGTDTITDFKEGKDILALDGGLKFEDLKITDGTGSYNGDTIISSGRQQIAILNNVDADDISAENFIIF